jgi:PKD repeat protein
MGTICRFKNLSGALILLVLSGSVRAATADSFEPDNDNAADNTAAGAAGVNQLSFASASSRSLAKSITSGTTQLHSINNPGTFLPSLSFPVPADRDYVKFTLTVASDIIIQTDEDIGPPNTTIHLFDNSGNEIGFDSGGNPLNNGGSSLVVTALDPGTYFACVESSDLTFSPNIGSTIESYKLSFLAGATGTALSPLITSLSTGSGALGAKLSYDIAALGSPPLTFTATGLPPGLALAGTTISGTPTQLGTFTTAITVSNSAGKSTANITFTINSFGIIATVGGDGRGRYFGDGGLATQGSIKQPNGVAVDKSGNIFIADTMNNVVRKVDAATGVITTIAGNGLPGYSGDGGNATSAKLNFPCSVAVDSAGNVLISDSNNHAIRRVSTAGIITRVAGAAPSGGIGTAGNTGNTGLAINALLDFPTGITVDTAGNIFFVDTNNAWVLKIDTSGNITNVAGNGTPGNTGDNGPATAATLDFSDPNIPYMFGGVAVDSAGNVYIAEFQNCRVRKVSGGMITNFAGNFLGTSGYSGDDGPATAATLDGPTDVAVDSSGNVFITDQNNNVIRRVSGGIITTIVGGGTPDFSLTDLGASQTDGGAAANAILDGPTSAKVDAAGNIIIADSLTNRIRKAGVAIAPSITSALTATAALNAPFAPPYRVLVSGFPAPTVTVTGLPAGLSFANPLIAGVSTQSGVTDVTLTATNPVGSDTKVLRLTITGSTAPAMTFSDTAGVISASPNPAQTGSNITFVAPLLANGADLKGYSWNFNDPASPAPGTGAVVTHAYSTTGVYTVTLTVTDGTTTLTSSTVVGVNPSDVTEDIIISKVGLKFDFKNKNKDSISVSGTMPVRKAGSLSGAVVQVFISSITQSFKLDGKGNGTKNGKNDSFKLSAKQSSGAIDKAGNFVSGKFSLNLKAGSFQTSLALLGFQPNVTTPRPIKLPILVSINSDTYVQVVTIVFKSSDKSGTGTKLKEGGPIGTR